jgi:hypothetical protein
LAALVLVERNWLSSSLEIQGPYSSIVSLNLS